MFTVFRIVILLSCCLLCSCSWTQKTFPAFISSPTKQLHLALERDDLCGASSIYQENKEWFLANRKDFTTQKLLSTLASRQLAKHLPAIARPMKDLGNLAPPEQRASWPYVTARINEASQLLQDICARAPFTDRALWPQELAQLKQRLENTIQHYEDKAFLSFLLYPKDAEVPFFTNYPIPLIPTEFFVANQTRLLAWAKKLSRTDIIILQKKYGAWLPQACQKVLAARFFLLDSKQSKLLGFKQWMHSYVQLQEIGLAHVIDTSMCVHFVPATSKSALEEERIAFPIAIDNDLNIRALMAENSLNCTRVKESADVVIAISVMRSDCQRHVSGCQQKTYQDGLEIYSDSPESFQASLKKQHDDIFAQNEEKRDGLINEAQQWLLGPSKKDPKKENTDRVSSYQVCEVQSNKSAVLAYALWDRKTKQLTTDSIVIKNASNFQTARKLSGFPGGTEPPHGLVSEDIVARFESDPIEIPLSIIFLHAFENKQGWKRASLTELLPLLKTVQGKTHSSPPYDVAPSTDPRFSSIVSVHHGGQGISSGFYVSKHFVLTSFPQLTPNALVTLWRANGQKTHGTVVAKDDRTNLVLIRTHLAGQPLTLLSKPLQTGEEVVAHGYSKESGITKSRGIIGVVKSKEIGLCSAGKAQVIQTDCLSHEQSRGGPLFLGEMVIGISCFSKNTGKEILAVHWAEIANFIEHSKGLGKI